MSKPIYKSEKPYQEDINDLVEKGGVGSGIRGHKTARNENSKIMNRKTGKMVQTDDFYEEVRQGLMNYSGFSDRPGAFMSVKQVANAISKETGHSAATSFDMAKELIRRGQVKQVGKVFMVMKNSGDAGRKEAKVAEGLASAHGQMVATMNEANRKKS